MLVSAEELAAYRARHPKWEENNKTLLRAFDPEGTPVEVGWVYEMKDGECFVVRRIDYGNLALTPDTGRHIVPAPPFDKRAKDTVYYSLEQSDREVAAVSLQKITDGKPAEQLRYKQDENGFKRPIHCPKMSMIPLAQFLDAMKGGRVQWHGDSPLIDAEARKKTVLAMAEAFGKIDKNAVKIMPELDDTIANRKKSGK